MQHICTVTAYLQLGHVYLMAVLQVWGTKGLQKQEANTMSMQL